MSAVQLDFTIDEFRTTGFVVVENILSGASIACYRDALEEALAQQESAWSGHPAYRDRGMAHNPMIYNEIFLEFLRNERLLDHLEAALDEYCILYAFTASSMLPSEQNFSSRIHVDCPRVIPNYVSNVGFLVALDDFTEENGATYYLPKSQERVEIPSEAEFFANAIRPLVKAGDGVMFNARTWHCGGRNRTDHARHALTVNVCRSYMKQRFDYPRLLGERTLQLLDERSKRFLGYRTRTPVTLEDYYKPDADRLYWPGQG